MKNTEFKLEIEVTSSNDDGSIFITLWYHSEKNPKCTFIPHDVIEIGYGIAVDMHGNVVGTDVTEIVDNIINTVREHLTNVIGISNKTAYDQYINKISKYLTTIISTTSLPLKR